MPSRANKEEYMNSLVDLVLIKDRSVRRSDVEKILSLTTEVIKEHVKNGDAIYWAGLCTFTWKKKADTKKEAKEWAEFPYLANGDKPRCLPDKDMNGLSAKEGIMTYRKEETITAN